MGERLMIEDAVKHPWKLGCVTCQREAEDSARLLADALERAENAMASADFALFQANSSNRKHIEAARVALAASLSTARDALETYRKEEGGDGA